MSPVGGVGINLAIQEALAAANLLSVPLQTRQLSETSATGAAAQRAARANHARRADRDSEAGHLPGLGAYRQAQLTVAPAVALSHGGTARNLRSPDRYRHPARVRDHTRLCRGAKRWVFQAGKPAIVSGCSRQSLCAGVSYPLQRPQDLVSKSIYRGRCSKSRLCQTDHVGTRTIIPLGRSPRSRPAWSTAAGQNRRYTCSPASYDSGLRTVAHRFSSNVSRAR